MNDDSRVERGFVFENDGKRVRCSPPGGGRIKKPGWWCWGGAATYVLPGWDVTMIDQEQVEGIKGRSPVPGGLEDEVLQQNDATSTASSILRKINTNEKRKPDAPLSRNAGLEITRKITRSRTRFPRIRGNQVRLG